MTDDPPRLKDSSGPGNALLRRAGRVPPMAHDDRAAILGALGAGAAGGAGGAGATTSGAGAGATTGGAGSAGGGMGSAGGAAAATLKTPLALALVGALLGGAAVVAVRAWSATPAPETAPPPTAPAAAAPASAIVPPPPLPAPTEAPPVAAPATPPVKHARGAPSASQPAEDTLAAESALVGRARATLEPTPAAALALLEDHARRFPRGELAAERDFLRIKALRRVDRSDEARERARTYATKYPSSPYAPAVRTILADLGEQ